MKLCYNAKKKNIETTTKKRKMKLILYMEEDSGNLKFKHI